jgi:protein SCO1/2
MGRGVAIVSLVLAAVVCAGVGPAAADTKPAFAGSELPDQPRATDFTLRDQRGRTVSLASQRGHFVLLTFLYTHCPDVCPLIATHLSDALERLPAARRSTVVLAVSTDPRRDTPAAARAFVRSHGLVPQFHFLVGSERALERIWNAYHVAVLPGKDVVGHSAFVLLIDRSGRERVVYDSRVRTRDVQHDLSLLLRKPD